MPLAYWCVLVAASLPIAIVSFAKSGGGDNHHPRDDVGRLSGARRRAYAAHLNAYENFPFFAAAVIIAVTQGATLGTVNMPTAVTRCHQKSEVPEPEAPRKRTRASGVRIEGVLGDLLLIVRLRTQRR